MIYFESGKSKEFNLSDYKKLLYKRQHGMLKCKVCGNKLKRLPKGSFSEDGNNQNNPLFIDVHIKCLGDLK